MAIILQIITFTNNMSYFTFESIGIAAGMAMPWTTIAESHERVYVGTAFANSVSLPSTPTLKNPLPTLTPLALITGAARLSAMNQHSHWGLRLALPLW